MATQYQTARPQLSADEAIDPLFIEAIKGSENSISNDSTPEQLAKAAVAISPKGAVGTMQILPSTFDEFKDEGDVITDPVANEKVGTRYLKHLYTQLGSRELTAAAYNWGIGRVQDFLKDKPKDYAALKDHLLDLKNRGINDETYDYVEKTMNLYNKKTGQATETRPPAKTPEEVAAARKAPMFGDANAYKDAVLEVSDEPGFYDMPLTDQLKSIHDVYQKGTWDADANRVLKKLSTNLSAVAPEEDQIDIGHLVGDAPPIAPEQDPNQVIDNWKEAKIQEMLRSGVNPAMLGDRFDNYFDEVKKDQSAAHEYRNRGALETATDFVGNSLRYGVKGAVESVTSVGKGAAALFGASEPYLKAWDAPSEMLGTEETVNRDFLHEVDENGFVVYGEDGKANANWMPEVSAAIGNVGASLVTGKAIFKAATLAGQGIKVAGATIFSKDAIQIAGDTFHHVKTKTDDNYKAYAAAVASLPGSALVGSLGELAVVSKLISPSLKKLSQANKNAYLARMFAKKATVEGSAEALSDYGQQKIQQAAEGDKADPYDKRKTLISGLAGAGAGGLFGVVEQSQNNSFTFAQRDKAAGAAESFQQGLETSQVVDINPEHFDEDHLAISGIKASPEANGAKTRLSRDLVPHPIVDEAAMIDTLNNLKNSVTPAEYTEMQQKRATLLQEKNPTVEQRRELEVLDATLNVPLDEHLKNTKSVEKSVADFMTTNPAAGPYVHTEDGWQNAETGETSPYLKDLVIKNSTRPPKADLSDVSSYTNIIDEDDFSAPQVPTETDNTIATLETEAATHKSNLDSLIQLKKDKQLEIKNLKAANTKIKQVNQPAVQHNAELQQSISQTQSDLNNVNKSIAVYEKEPVVPSTKETEGTRLVNDISKDLEKVKEQLKTLRGQKAKGKAKDDLSNQIADLSIQQDALSQKLKKTKSVYKEDLAKDTAAKESLKNQQLKEDLVSRREVLNKKLKELNETKPRELQPTQETETSTTELLDIENNINKTDKAYRAVSDKLTPLATSRNQARDQQTANVAKVSKLKNDEQGFGKTTFKDGKSEILISGGWPPAAKSQLLAHELGHAVHNVVGTLPPSVTDALNAESRKLTERGKFDSAALMAQNVLLPEILQRTPVADVPLNKLKSKKDRDALVAPRELFANMAGAYMLERQGVKTPVHIPQAVRDFLSTLKLPDIDVTTGKVKKAVKVEAPIVNLPKDVTPEPEPGTSVTSSIQVVPIPVKTANNDVGETSPIQPTPPAINEGTDPGTTVNEPVSDPGTTVNEPVSDPTDLRSLTGEQGETAFSKRLTEGNDLPKDLYYKMNLVDSRIKADQFVNEIGVEKATNLLEHPDGKGVTVESLGFLSEAVLKKSQQEYSDSRTVEDAAKLSNARRLRSRVGTIFGQGLRSFTNAGMAGAKSLGEFVTLLQDAFASTHGHSKELTDYARSKIEAVYDKLAKADPSDTVLKEKLLYEASKIKLNNDGINWSDFTVGAVRQNYLSSGGSLAINGVGGSAMGLAFSMATHPTMLPTVFRSLVNSHRKGILAAKRAFSGSDIHYVTDALDVSIGDMKPSVFNIHDTSTKTRAVVSGYNFIARKLVGALNAADAYNRTQIAEIEARAKRLKDLRKEYGDNPQKLSEEYAKLFYNPDTVESTLADIRKRYEGVEGLDEKDFAAEAFSKLSPLAGQSPEFISDVKDWTDLLSLRHNPRNPLLQFIQRGLDRSVNDSKIAREVKAFVFPFSRAFLNIMEIGFDSLPGSMAVDSAMKAFVNYRKGPNETPITYSAAQRRRQVTSQILGATVLTSAAALLASGDLEITTEEEKSLNREEGKTVSGDKARTAQDRAEFNQKERPTFSFRVGSGPWISYKDHPWLASVMYGLKHAHDTWKASDQNPSDAIEAAANFYMKGGAFAMGYAGGQGIAEPYTKIIDKLFEEDTPILERGKDAFAQFATNISKGAIPFSGALRDIKKLYDDTPEDYHQNVVKRLFKDYPLVSELIGSEAQLNVFGEPTERSLSQRIPGLGRLGGTPVVFSPTEQDLYKRGLIVPELPNRLHINQSDVGSQKQFETYISTPGNRLGKALTNTFTNDEYRAFVLATGPQVKRVVTEEMNRNLSTERTQQNIIDRVKNVRDVARRRYVKSGKFQ